MHDPYQRVASGAAWCATFALLAYGTHVDSHILYVWAVVVAIVAATLTIACLIRGLRRSLWTFEDQTWLDSLNRRHRQAKQARTATLLPRQRS